MFRKRSRGKRFGVDLEEFRALVQNLVPVSDEQAKWICNEIERLTHEHPELKTKIEEWAKQFCHLR